MGTCQYYFVVSKTVSSTQSPFRTGINLPISPRFKFGTGRVLEFFRSWSCAVPVLIFLFRSSDRFRFVDPWLSVKLTNFKTNPTSKVSYVERTIFEFNSKDGNRKYLIELWDYKGDVWLCQCRWTDVGDKIQFWWHLQDVNILINDESSPTSDCRHSC